LISFTLTLQRRISRYCSFRPGASDAAAGDDKELSMQVVARGKPSQAHQTQGNALHSLPAGRSTMPPRRRWTDK